MLLRLSTVTMPPMPFAVWKYFTRSSDTKSASYNFVRDQPNLSWSYIKSSKSCKENKHAASLSGSDSSDNKKQVSMSAFVCSPKKVSTSESERITCAIPDMIVKDYVPLSVVEGESFCNLMQIVAPAYKVLCRNTVSARIVR